MIDYDIVKNLLGLSVLIYSYGNKFKLNLNENITEYLEKNKLDDLIINDTLKSIIKNYKKNSPLGEVLYYINDNYSDLQCIVTKSIINKRINVIFRGSDSLTDWYYDFSIFKKKLKDNIYIHSGFYNHLTYNNNHEKILNIIKQEINNIENDITYDIYISGHSLGGALSTLFGYILSHEIKNKITIVSFASPRIGDNNWKKSFNDKINLNHYRVSNEKDIVVATPFINFYHVGKSIILSDKKYKYYNNYNYAWWWDFSILKCNYISDHNCLLYYERLLNIKW